MPDQSHSELVSLGYWPTINAYYHQGFAQSSLLLQVFAGRGPIDAARLAKAVEQVSARHPLLSQQLSLDDDKATLGVATHSVGGLQTLQVEQLNKLEVARDVLNAGLGDDMWSVVLVQSDSSPGQWLLLMVCHHAIGDGLSLAAFFDQLLSVYAEPVQSGAAVLEAPALPEELVGVDIPVSKADSSITEWPLEKFVNLNERRVGLVNVPVEIESIEELLAACQRERVSLTNLITAALLRAQALEGRTKVATAVDIRRRVSPPIGIEYFGCYAGMVESSVPSADDIWHHARLCAVFQFRGTSRLIMPVPRGSLLTNMMRMRIDSALKKGFFAAGCAVSDIGELPVARHYGELEVESMLLTNRQLAGLYSLFLTTFIFDGKLNLNMSFADPLMSKAAVEAIGQRMSVEILSSI